MAKNYNEVMKKYLGKIIVVENGEVVAVGSSYGDVYCPFKEEKRSIMPLVLKLSHPDDLVDGYLL